MHQLAYFFATEPSIAQSVFWFELTAVSISELMQLLGRLGLPVFIIFPTQCIFPFAAIKVDRPLFCPYTLQQMEKCTENEN